MSSAAQMKAVTLYGGPLDMTDISLPVDLTCVVLPRPLAPLGANIASGFTTEGATAKQSDTYREMDFIFRRPASQRASDGATTFTFFVHESLSWEDARRRLKSEYPAGLPERAGNKARAKLNGSPEET
jgi:hypothetical protein